MMKPSNHAQGGFSFLLFFFMAAMVIFALVFAMKIIPPYMQNSSIIKIFKSITSDPAMADATSNEIRDSFSKRAGMDGINNLRAEDIEIEKGEGPLRLSASYSVKVPLVANIFLLIEFNPSSS